MVLFKFKSMLESTKTVDKNTSHLARQKIYQVGRGAQFKLTDAPNLSQKF